MQREVGLVGDTQCPRHTLHRVEVRRGDTRPRPWHALHRAEARPGSGETYRAPDMPSPTAWRCQEWGFTVPHQRGCCPFPRLLAQLNETEAAFDEFWAKHQQKLEQCLQLRHFEQDFREVSGLGGCGGARARVMRPVGTACGLEEPGVGLEPQC